jgi:hypothetical protein
MGIFSRLFRSAVSSKEKDSASPSKSDAQQMLQFLEEISLAILGGSQTCAEQTNASAGDHIEKEVSESKVLVFYEYLYFFLHMTMREAYSQLTKQQLGRLQSQLGPLVSSIAVDSFFAHWPDDLKSRIRNEFCEKLNDSELEYSSCKKMISDSPMASDSLFSRLALNVADLVNKGTNPAFHVMVISIAIDAYKDMQLDSLMRRG